MKSPRVIKDITGKRFSRLVAIKPVRSNHSGVYWLFICDCGTEKVMLRHNVTSSNVKSCGCLAKDMPRGKKPHGVSARNRVFKDYRRSASLREVAFNLEIDEFIELTKADCHYCGEAPSNVHGGSERCNGLFIYSGLDRVDNLKGYEYDNCVPCCSFCNRAKNDHPVHFFLSRVKRIYERLKLGETL